MVEPSDPKEFPLVKHREVEDIEWFQRMEHFEPNELVIPGCVAPLAAKTIIADTKKKGELFNFVCRQLSTIRENKSNMIGNRIRHRQAFATATGREAFMSGNFLHVEDVQDVADC